MHSEHRTNLDCTLHASAVVKLETSISMDEAQRKLESLGNQIIERDDEARTFKILDTVEHPSEVWWVCDFCGAVSLSEQVILEHEAKEHGS